MAKEVIYEESQGVGKHFEGSYRIDWLRNVNYQVY